MAQAIEVEGQADTLTLSGRTVKWGIHWEDALTSIRQSLNKHTIDPARPLLKLYPKDIFLKDCAISLIIKFWK